jgi:hypothetical protein
MHPLLSELLNALILLVARLHIERERRASPKNVRVMYTGMKETSEK